MIYLTTDHSGLNKFHGLEDENFCLVRPEIQRMVQTAPSKIEARYHCMSFVLIPLAVFVETSLTSCKHTLWSAEKIFA